MSLASPDTAPPPPGRLRPTREGGLWLGTAAVLGGIAWFKSLNLLLLFAYVMAGLFVLNALLAWRHGRRVRATRSAIPPVYAGEAARVRIIASNSSRSAATVEVVEQDRQWHLDRIPAGAAVECVERRTFPHRGRVPNTRPVVQTGFPFGLVRYERPGDGVEPVVVLPALGRADADGLRRWLMRQAGGEGRSRKVLRRVSTDHADVRGVRPFRPGDSIRAVHWKSTARRGELMVREYDTAPSPDLVLVVEPWLPANPTSADRTKLEAALSLAATVIRTWACVLEKPVTVVVAGAEPAAASGPPTDLGSREASVPLAEATGGTTFAPIPPAEFGRPLWRSARVVVSSRPNSPLVATLGRAAGKPFAALDPSTYLPWYQPPATSV